MNTKDLASKLLELEDTINDAVCDLAFSLNSLFQSTNKSNEDTEKEMHMHSAMVNHLICSRLSSKWKKEYEKSKKHLDTKVLALGTDPSGIPEATVNLFESNVFRFSKRQNVTGTTTLVTDLVTALARAGVEKDVIDSALKTATKPKRGNVYYKVTTVDE